MQVNAILKKTANGTSIPSARVGTFKSKSNEPIPFASYVFETFSLAIKKHCPFLWTGMSEERLSSFAKLISPHNIIEVLRMSIIWFGNDKARMKDNLCNLHIDIKNDKKFTEVIVFSKVI